MTQLVKQVGTSVAPFEAKATRKRDAQADAVIEYAKTIRDWPLLEGAVDAKIKEQREFVGWWGEKVSKGHGGKRQKQVRGTTYLSFERAEQLTKITHQQEEFVGWWDEKVRPAGGQRTNNAVRGYLTVGELRAQQVYGRVAQQGKQRHS